MADIALLVAEEYERRVKNARRMHQGQSVNEEEIEFFFPQVSVSAKRVADLIKMKIKNNGGEEGGKVDLVKRVFPEPKTAIGDAASRCFFSS